MKIKVRNNNVESALRVFKKKCADVVYEVRERQYYEKPSQRKKLKKKAAIRREQKRKNK